MESYADVYTTLGCVALAAALLLWLLAPLLTKRMHESAAIEQSDRSAPRADTEAS